MTQTKVIGESVKQTNRTFVKSYVEEYAKAITENYRRYHLNTLNGNLHGNYPEYAKKQLAEIENDSNLVEVYSHLAESEQRHVDLWQQELAKLDADNTLPEPSIRAKALMWIARKFSPDLVLPVIKAFESDAASMYVGDSVAELEMLPADEASHARVFAALESSSGASGNMISRLEQRHSSFASRDTLRAGVLGSSDGLVSNMLLVAGFAGANPSQEAVVLAGFAGLLAGSISMGLGEWISVTTTKEAAQAQIDMTTQLVANKRLDFELARLKNCGDLMQKGIMFHPKSPYASICADIVVTQARPGSLPDHTHKLGTPPAPAEVTSSDSVPSSESVSPDSDLSAVPDVPEQIARGRFFQGLSLPWQRSSSQEVLSPSEVNPLGVLQVGQMKSPQQQSSQSSLQSED